MALINPLHVLMVPFLLIVTIPLAVFAGITSTLAFSVLFFRVLMVYVDIAIALLPKALPGLKSSRLQHKQRQMLMPAVRGNSPSPSTQALRKRRRRPSSASAISVGSVTPGGETASLGLLPSVGAERDFEGVGGWRDGNDDNWTTVNARSEWPEKQYRNHSRSASGGPTTPGEGGYLMMKSRTRSPETKVGRSLASPNSSRTRTPSGPRMTLAALSQHDGYFPLSMAAKARKT